MSMYSTTFGAAHLTCDAVAYGSSGAQLNVVRMQSKWNSNARTDPVMPVSANISSEGSMVDVAAPSADHHDTPLEAAESDAIPAISSCVTHSACFAFHVTSSGPTPRTDRPSAIHSCTTDASRPTQLLTMPVSEVVYSKTQTALVHPALSRTALWCTRHESVSSLRLPSPCMET